MYRDGTYKSSIFQQLRTAPGSAPSCCEVETVGTLGVILWNLLQVSREYLSLQVFSCRQSPEIPIVFDEWHCSTLQPPSYDLEYFVS